MSQPPPGDVWLVIVRPVSAHVQGAQCPYRIMWCFSLQSPCEFSVQIEEKIQDKAKNQAAKGTPLSGARIFLCVV